MNQTEQKKVYVHITDDKANQLGRQAASSGLTTDQYCQEILSKWIRSRKPIDPSKQE